VRVMAYLPSIESGGVEYPHDTPPHSLMLPPTFEYSSFPSVPRPFSNTIPASFLSRDSPDDPRAGLNGTDFLDCPEARMGGVDGYRHSRPSERFSRA
jgi:hypothetical protein